MLEADFLPDQLQALTPRQFELARTIYEEGGATVVEVHARMENPPGSLGGIRTLLNRMVRRGLLKKRGADTSSKVLYLPALIGPDVQRRALSRIADRHFDGSVQRTIEVLARLATEDQKQRGSRRSKPHSAVKPSRRREPVRAQSGGRQ